MRLVYKFFELILFCCTPILTFAWDVTGHRIVGEIAYYHLTPSAKEKVHSILGDESMAIVANWADFIRNDKTYEYLTSWHYINVPDGLNENEFDNYLQTDTAANVYNKIEFIIQQLKNKNLSKINQNFYLKMLIHLVGDAHQPMHVSRATDLGGNKVSVLWFKDTSNLHKIWDDDLINFQQLSYTEYASAINHANARQISKWQQEPIKEWLFESYNISQQLYAEIKIPYQHLNYQYNFDHIQIVNQQLLKAGIRLAGILNQLFG